MAHLHLVGAGAFGAIIGWYVYYVNRYRKGEVQFSDITTVIGVVGGASVLQLFGNDKTLFGAYGIGLFIGFFGYFTTLLIHVTRSENFNNDWFLDGRRKKPEGPWYVPGEVAPSIRPMIAEPVCHCNFPVGASPQMAPLVTINTGSAQVHAPTAAQFPQPLDVKAKNKADQIIQACKELREIEENANYCNKFVSAVGNTFNVLLSGNADDIVNQIRGANWTQHKHDGQAAAFAAVNGKFVVAGMTSAELGSAHGHVVVVVKGPLAFDKYPTAYWGSENELIRPNGKMGTTINYSFSKDDRDKVTYASIAV
ncbi:MAG: hypothetical protein ABIL58_12875 [Pseudomonadota bacterium]